MEGPQALTDVESVPHGHTAVRVQWEHLPASVRGLVEAWLGSPVVEVQSQGAGFTPGFASRLTGREGGRLFVKAAAQRAHPAIAESYAEEARKRRLLPSDLPAPPLLRQAEEDAWVVLAFEDVAGRQPRRPWDDEELARCLDLLAQVAALTEQIPEGLDLEPVHLEMPTLLTGWGLVGRTRPSWPHLREADELARSFAELPGADRFVHTDARDDNVILAEDGRTLLCDWNWPALGPVWLDVVSVLVSAHGDGLDADALLDEHPLTAGVAADQIDSWLAALSGFMVEADDRPGPPSSPWLGVHRRWWAAATWDWLARRRGWEARGI